MFDIIISLSAYDHTGLGRYGDPLSPDGDLLAIDDVRTRLLKPGGLLFLSLPVGPDLLVWNAMRRYGPLRLPLMLEGWETVDTFGWEEDALTRVGPLTPTFEPLWVLRHPTTPREEAVVVGEQEEEEQEL